MAIGLAASSAKQYTINPNPNPNINNMYRIHSAMNMNWFILICWAGCHAIIVIHNTVRLSSCWWTVYHFGWKRTFHLLINLWAYLCNHLERQGNLIDVIKKFGRLTDSVASMNKFYTALPLNFFWLFPCEFYSQLLAISERHSEWRTIVIFTFIGHLN